MAKKNAGAMWIITLVIIVLIYLVISNVMMISKSQNATIGVSLVASGFVSPMELTFANDSSGRMFIIDRPGLIYIIDPNNVMIEKPFLNITDRVVKLNPAYDERGLLGIAFHPDFRHNGKIYAVYNTNLRASAPKDWDSTWRLSEFTVSADPNYVDPSTERVLLEVDKPYMNHNGGQILFGPDGYLYFSIGDGGNANDVGRGHNPTIGNAQDTFSMLGKIHRIDVNTRADGKQYGIPKDNPFADGKNGLPEIYAYGLRNPWRMSFDAAGQHDLFVGNVGQNLWESIDKVVNGGNYGWNIREGDHCFNPKNADVEPSNCSSVGYKGEPLLAPIVEYKNAVHGGIGHANLGGFIYRGSAIPEFYGKFIFADWSTDFAKPDGSLFIAEPQTSGLWQFKQFTIAGKSNGRLGTFILSFGHDQNNELYISTTGNTGPAGNTGKVYKLVPANQ